MKIEVTIKLTLDLEGEVKTTDNGLNDMIQEYIIEEIRDGDLDFQADNDEDVACTMKDGEILKIEKTND